MEDSINFLESALGYVIVGEDKVWAVFERAMYRLTDTPTVIGLRNG